MFRRFFLTQRSCQASYLGIDVAVVYASLERDPRRFERVIDGELYFKEEDSASIGRALGSDDCASPFKERVSFWACDEES
jgi:hypothetical protein